jgi:hypothetical protein
LTCVAHNCSALKHLFDSTISQALLFSTRKVYRVDLQKNKSLKEKKIVLTGMSNHFQLSK